MNEYTKKLHSLLFYTGRKIRKSTLYKKYNFPNSELDIIIDQLKEYTKESGVVLIDDGEYIVLTHPSECLDFIESITQKEYTSNLSQTSKEILSLILYAGPISKVNIDFLRGVNSQYTIRQLMIRGLIQEIEQKSKCKFYTVTVEYMAHIGIKETNQAKNYEKYNKEIEDSLSIITGSLNNQDKENI